MRSEAPELSELLMIAGRAAAAGAREHVNTRPTHRQNDPFAAEMRGEWAGREALPLQSGWLLRGVFRYNQVQLGFLLVFPGALVCEDV